MPGKRTSIRLPKELAETARIYARQEGGKKVSSWVNRVLAEYLEADPVLERVGVGEADAINDGLLSFTLMPETKERLDNAVSVLRRQDPFMDGPASAVIRAAIRFGLAGFEGDKEADAPAAEEPYGNVIPTNSIEVLSE